jgi:hypothetical protein
VTRYEGICGYGAENRTCAGLPFCRTSGSDARTSPLCHGASGVCVGDYSEI